jgi:hypothetical protein
MRPQQQQQQQQQDATSCAAIETDPLSWLVETMMYVRITGFDSRKRQVHFSLPGKLLGQADPLHCTQLLVLFPQTAYASIITVLHHHQQHTATMLSKEAIKSLISDCDEEWLEAFMMFETNKTTAVETHPSELGRRLGERATPKQL